MDTVFMKGCGFDEEFVKSAIKELLEAIDLLHPEVQAVHTGRQPFFISSCMQQTYQCTVSSVNDH